MLPNFIIIGAAKAGTTALYWYLAEHPQVFMSPLKETNFFAFGLDPEGKPLYGNPEVHRYPVQTLADYEKLFADAGDAKAIGEASPIYLECPQAAGRIRGLIPRARHHLLPQESGRSRVLRLPDVPAELRTTPRSCTGPRPRCSVGAPGLTLDGDQPLS